MYAASDACKAQLPALLSFRGFRWTEVLGELCTTSPGAANSFVFERSSLCCAARPVAVHASLRIVMLASLLQTHYTARQLLNLFSLVALTPRRSSTEFSSTASGSMTARCMP